MAFNRRERKPPPYQTANNMKPIKFVTETTSQEREISPWVQPKKSTFNDLILKPEFEGRRLRLPMGESWLRLVPALANSPFTWLFVAHVLCFEGGRFAHPKSLRPNAKSVFDHAYAWIRTNHPDQLFSKENKAGIRLLTDPVCLFWVLIQEEGKWVTRLFQGSGYDGSRGGAPGLGYKIWELSREVDEHGEAMPSITDPKSAVMLRIEKSQPKGAKYPSYHLRRGSIVSPIDDRLATMEAEEVDVLCPIEEVVQGLSEEEQWKCLEKLIHKSWVSQIRESLNR